ncbi:hypothetical protein [Peribacillus kribbensis]|uniref:hypothetical protein n=1 Tax=Peribacillus kribbensis TaxID=356658 RepID=UPI00047EA75D|nr:hypothetical protein [Peribacillus kribbensis]
MSGIKRLVDDLCKCGGTGWIEDRPCVCNPEALPLDEDILTDEEIEAIKKSLGPNECCRVMKKIFGYEKGEACPECGTIIE